MPDESDYLDTEDLDNDGPDEDRPSLTLTDEDIADGNHLGETIDIDDDEDSGVDL